MVTRLQSRKPPRGLLAPDRRRRRAFVVGLQERVKVRVGPEHLHGPRRPRPGNADQKERSGLTARRRAHRRSVALRRRRGLLSDPQALDRLGLSARCAAVIEARVLHAPTGLPERSKVCREAGCRARVVSPSVMAVNDGLRRAVGVGSARRVADVRRRDRALSPSVSWLRGGAPRTPGPSATKCDPVRHATSTS
jgi:hypothetical protein